MCPVTVLSFPSMCSHCKFKFKPQKATYIFQACYVTLNGLLNYFKVFIIDERITFIVDIQNYKQVRKESPVVYSCKKCMVKQNQIIMTKFTLKSP